MTFPREHIIMPPKDKAPVHTGNIAAWMWYFLLPYKYVIYGFFTYRFIRYTILAFVPIILGYVIDGFESGAVFENTSYYALVLFGYMALFTAVLTPNIVFKHEARVVEKACGKSIAGNDFIRNHALKRINTRMA